MLGAVHNVITPANFDEDRLRGFGVASGRIWAFYTDLLHCHYNTLTTMHVCDFDAHYDHLHLQ